jgi:hypothetical protein
MEQDVVDWVSGKYVLYGWPGRVGSTMGIAVTP